MGTELPGSSTQAVRDDAQWGWNPRGVFDGMSGVMDAARNSVYSPTNLKMPSLEMPPVQSPLSLFAARNTTDAGVEDECQALRAAKVVACPWRLTWQHDMQTLRVPQNATSPRMHVQACGMAMLFSSHWP